VERRLSAGADDRVFVMDQRLSLVTLGVADLGRACRFYEDGLGWKRGNKEDSVAFFQLPGSILALWSRASLAEDARLPDTGAGFSGIVLAYNARSREEVDGVLGQAKAAGARILKPAAETSWGGYSGYFADLDGHPWEVAHNPFWTLDAEGRVSLNP
jgi:catechol 2,3-dioxygenase-like lactoylglutathione lyase family enzyme